MDVCIQQSNINIQTDTFAILPEATESLNRLVDSFDAISLAEMDSVRLMNRVDTKFLIEDSQLPELMEKALKQYRIVEVDGNRTIPYSTIYFDTVDTEMYLMHHNGKLNRIKVRMRSYIDSGISFLEIKTKTNKGRTSKKRIVITNDQFSSMQLDEKEQLFIKNFSDQSLKPQLQNSFQRITLVDKNLTERITLDTHLAFKNLSDGACKSVEKLVIIEMKQEGACGSFFRDYLNELRINPESISKYCLGMVMVNPVLKSNRFKSKLRIINKITEKNHGTIKFPGF